MITNAFVDQASAATDSEWLVIAAACAKQHREHVAPAWGLEPTQTTYLTDTSQAASGMRLVIARNLADVEGALAYHEELNGIPVSYIFVVTTKQNGDAVSVSASHENAEMDGNPFTDSDGKWFLAPDGFEYAGELCDPTEGDVYEIDGVQVSNFVYRSYFDANGKAPFDHMGLITRPFEIRPGGYAIRRNTRTGAIDQVYGATREQWRIDAKNHPASRASRIIRAAATQVAT